MRLRRKILGLSQAKLADALGVTFQQVQKYERGANRIGASGLAKLAWALDVPISFFFDEIDPAGATSFPDRFAAMPKDDLLRSPESLELVRTYYAIADPKTRRLSLDLVRQLCRNGAASR